MRTCEYPHVEEGECATCGTRLNGQQATSAPDKDPGVIFCDTACALVYEYSDAVCDRGADLVALVEDRLEHAFKFSEAQGELRRIAGADEEHVRKCGCKGKVTL